MTKSIKMWLLGIFSLCFLLPVKALQPHVFITALYFKEGERVVMGNVVLQMQHITKRYPGVVALNDVSVDFEAGQVHALLGENGAGKSTLIKVLSEAIENDEGQMIIDGQTYAKMSPVVSRNHGIEVIYQVIFLINNFNAMISRYLPYLDRRYTLP